MKRSSGFSGGALVFPVCFFRLTRDYVGRTRAFLALSDIKLNLLAFIETGVAGRLDLRMMNKQVIAGDIGCDKSKAFTTIKPLYNTCTHYSAPFGLLMAIKSVSRIFEENILERRENIPHLKTHCTRELTGRQ